MSSRAERRAAVEAIYATFVAKDLARVRATTKRYFAPDIVIREPESLPYGGVYEGLDAATALFSGLVDPQSPVDAAHLRIDALIASEDDPHVVGAVSFPWQPPGAGEALAMRALEWWTFRDLEVAEIQVFLWDSAACLESLRTAVT
jgi:uncharacterized protein